MLPRMADDDSTYQRLQTIVLDLDPVAAPTTELPNYQVS